MSDAPARGKVAGMKRRSFLFALPMILTTVCATDAAELSFYIGTYTKPEMSKGIYRASLNTDTGAITLRGLVAEAKNPTFLALHPNGKFLYSAIEMGGGAVGSFAIEKNGDLRRMNEESTKGKGNCHVWVDASGKNLLSTSYSGGSIASVPIHADGSLSPATAFIEHKGSGPNPARQTEPHAHSIYTNGAFAYACDLGTDDVFIYHFDAEKGTLTPNDPPSAKVPAGGGPRHLAFAPKGGFAYVCNEMGNSVTVFAHDAAKGTLAPIQTLPTLPADYADAAKSSTAEIFCHPNGKFLYVSNRGHNSIATFAIAADGKLSVVDYAPAHVKVPRGFALTPDGQWLVVGGQDSNNLASHKVDATTGRLTFVSETGGIGSPVNVQFAP